MKVHELPTPALLVDVRRVRPERGHHGGSAGRATTLRPHVKAFKSTALARRLADAGHPAFCCATVREMMGMAAAGLGDDLLLANESLDLDPAHARSSRTGGPASRSPSTPTRRSTPPPRPASARCSIDVDVGLPRCGCDPADAGRLADLARAEGLDGARASWATRATSCASRATPRPTSSSARWRCSLEAHAAVGGDVVSGGGTGTWDINTWVTELQAGSYCLMDTEYTPHACRLRERAVRARPP